jgi:N12 class adenine-specific DNA methylase
VDQFAKEFIRLYPNATILVVGRDEVGKDRNVLMAKIATGNWDGVIVSHSSFNRLPVRRETELAFETAELDEIEAALRAEQTGANDRRIVKTLERAKRKFEARMAELKERVRHDNTLCFEDLGVDYVAVDEAHLFKNLYYLTKMQVAGLNQSDSGRARDLYLKCRWLLKQHGRGLVFATGTPVANTVAELYTFMRYLAQDLLDKNDLSVFDNWAATFGETVTCLELAPEGQRYRVNTRFARFTNIPEMMKLTATFADIKTYDKLQLDRPAIHGDKPEIVIIPPTLALRTFIDQLGKRAEAVRNGNVDPREDNLLSITTEGRKAALDMRLIYPNMTAAEHTKASVAARRIADIWQETASDRGAEPVSAG